MYKQEQLQMVKNDISRHIGDEIIIKSNRGRQKIATHKAIIVGAYTSVFTVRTRDDVEFSRDISFSYVDVLTKNVKITLT